MIRCERCGTGFNPLAAAVLIFCPRCRTRDGVKVALIPRIVEDGSIHDSGADHGGTQRS